MGCPTSKVDAVRKRERLLFFTEHVEHAQRYALSRTSLILRLLGKDEPVVVQLEIPEDAEIKKEDLWHDPNLTRAPSPVPVYISFWPAIPKGIQEKTNLQVRIHHIVTCELQQKNGGICRTVQEFSKKRIL